LPTYGMEVSTSSRSFLREVRLLSHGASGRAPGGTAPPAQARRGPEGARLPSDQPSAGHRAGRGPSSWESIRCRSRDLRVPAMTTTVEVPDPDPAAGLAAAAGGALL